MNFIWFSEARQFINNATSTGAEPKGTVYEKAHHFLRRSGVGDVALIPMKGGFVDVNDHSINFDGLTSQVTRLFHPVRMEMPTGGHRSGGAARGMRVDAELEALVNNGAVPARGFTPFAVKTMQLLYAEGLKPFAAQVCVGWREAQIATALDLVCINMKTKGVVNVQLKTMGPKNYDTPSGAFMMSPMVQCARLTTMPDSIANRHRLQLITEHMITQLGYRCPLEKSVLLIVTDEYHRVIPLDYDIDLVKGVQDNLKKRYEKSALQVEIDAVKRNYYVRKALRKRKLTRRDQVLKVKKEKQQ